MASGLRQSGIVQVVVVALLALLGLGGGTAVLANNSAPGDPLFGLDKAIESLQVSLSGNEQARAELHLAIAKERVEEVARIPDDSEFVDEALAEVQSAVDEFETEIEENHIKIEAASLESLLTQLQSILTLYQGRIGEVEVNVEDDAVKAEIQLLDDEATESADLVEDALEDLKEDDDLDEFDSDADEDEDETEDEDDEDDDDEEDEKDDDQDQSEDETDED